MLSDNKNIEVNEIKRNMHMISIIVPVYNVQKYLERAINSILDQSFSCWELILIDDGSTDSSGIICDQYAKDDRRIRVIHQRNQGVSAARNCGIDIAEGAYIYCLDPDDYLPSDALELLYQRLMTTGADIVFAGHNRVEADGYIHCDSGNWPDLQTVRDIQKAIVKNTLPNFVWGKLYKRELWENIRMPVGYAMEDLYVCPKLFMKARRIVVDKTPLYFYSHENLQSIMAVDGIKYAKLRYGKFLAWREHELVAMQYFPEEAESCAKEAIYAAARARCLDAGIGILTDQEKMEIDLYIQAHTGISESKAIQWINQLILGHHERILVVLGSIQRMLVNYQQRRRQKKMQRKLAERMKISRKHMEI